MSDNTFFPTLYKKSSKGKISEWQIWVVGESGQGIIHILHGYTDGKKQHDTKIVWKGKNLGKANETTPFEQAVSEAESKWDKQRDKGYVDDPDKVDDIVYLPMLAHSYEKRGKDIEFPCVAQRKFDGIRCLIQEEGGEIVLTSRKGKKFPHLEHLHEESLAALSRYGDTLILDGELYSNELSFQRLNGLVKKKTLTPKDEEDMKKIHHRLYDNILPDNPEAPFAHRYTILETVSKGLTLLQLTKNFPVHSPEDIRPLLAQFVEEGYEGVILRNLSGIYGVNKRSKDLQKYKDFKDDEYVIVGFEEGEGRAQGTVIWICETKSGQPFRVRPRGTEEERRKWWDEGESYIGKELTVRYQELTDDGIPRFPVGIAVRDYE